jgi:hypothetical protein
MGSNSPAFTLWTQEYTANPYFLAGWPGFVGQLPGLAGPVPGLAGPLPGLAGPVLGFTGFPGFITIEAYLLSQQLSYFLLKSLPWLE